MKTRAAIAFETKRSLEIVEINNAFDLMRAGERIGGVVVY